MREDDATVTAAKAGDPAAWQELYTAHAGRLLLWLEARSPSRRAVAGVGADGPEDVAAAAWLVAAERIADFRGTSDDFGGWLFGIARNVALNAQRRSAVRGRGLAELGITTDATVPGPERGLIADEWVRHALAALPPRERDVIACTEVLELDTAHTAAALGLSAVAVRVARHRGLRRLRTLLAADPGSATDRSPAE